MQTKHFAYITLFKNDRPTAEGTNRPQYSGHLDLPDGRKLVVGLWDKVGKSGKPYMSGAISEVIDDTVNKSAEKVEITIPVGGFPQRKSQPTYQAGPAGGEDDLPF
jgi:hypothetical protein